MAKKKGKSVSFDAMVKFFMHTYEIPTKRDFLAMMNRLERIERLVLDAQSGPTPPPKRTRKTDSQQASQIVLEIIRRSADGSPIGEIQRQTGFAEKKLRNILFRLHKTGKITRKSRGVYIAA